MVGTTGIPRTDTLVSGNKQYLGDGVYVEHDEVSFILTTEDGTRTTNVIFMGPNEINALYAYVRHAMEDPKL